VSKKKQHGKKSFYGPAKVARINLYGKGCQKPAGLRPGIIENYPPRAVSKRKRSSALVMSRFHIKGPRHAISIKKKRTMRDGETRGMMTVSKGKSLLGKCERERSRSEMASSQHRWKMNSRGRNRNKSQQRKGTLYH